MVKIVGICMVVKKCSDFYSKIFLKKRYYKHTFYQGRKSYANNKH